MTPVILTVRTTDAAPLEVTINIAQEVVSAMVCNVALNAYGKALDLHVGEIHDKEPADNVEAGVGSLDAASPSEARAFIVELLEPLVGAAVTAAARHYVGPLCFTSDSLPC